jgi:hypothetical protein
MAVQINIRDVPEKVRDELAARAANIFRRLERARTEALKLPFATLDGPLSKSSGPTCRFLTP